MNSLYSAGRRWCAVCSAMLYLFSYLLHAVIVVAASVVVAVIGNLPKTSTRTHQILQFEACIVCIIPCVCMRTVSFKCWNWQKTRNVSHMRKTYFSPNFQFLNNIFRILDIFVVMQIYLCIQRHCENIVHLLSLVLSLSFRVVATNRWLTHFMHCNDFRACKCTHITEKQQSHSGVHTNRLSLCEQVNK